jgi:formylglycine-generating enzyme required for sulfatase activity
MMGSPDTERSRATDEGPVHEVTIGYDFYMGEAEVTQGQWEAVMGSNPATGLGVGRDYPVYNVSWDDCQAFIAALNALGQGTFRLPSEAEWEYACRAGTTSRFYFGNSLGCADGCENCDAAKGVIFVEQRSDFMWYCGNDEGSNHPVRQRFANFFGLYDMAGNVYEWCQDLYHGDYTGAPTDGSAWESGGELNRVIRGGGWFSGAGHCRSALRFPDFPSDRDINIGFRLARTP